MGGAAGGTEAEGEAAGRLLQVGVAGKEPLAGLGAAELDRPCHAGGPFCTAASPSIRGGKAVACRYMRGQDSDLGADTAHRMLHCHLLGSCLKGSGCMHIQCRWVFTEHAAIGWHDISTPPVTAQLSTVLHMWLSCAPGGWGWWLATPWPAGHCCLPGCSRQEPWGCGPPCPAPARPAPLSSACTPSSQPWNLDECPPSCQVQVACTLYASASAPLCTHKLARMQLRCLSTSCHCQPGVWLLAGRLQPCARTCDGPLPQMQRHVHSHSRLPP